MSTKCTCNQLKCKASTARSRKYLLLIVLLVFLTFPHASQEFGFKFSEDDDDNTSKQIIKRRQVDRKFKFRKIERVYVDDGDDDDNNDNDDDDNDSNDENNKDLVSYERSVAGKNRANDDDEIQIERARKKQKERQKTKTEKRKDHDDAPNDNSKSNWFFGNIFNGFFGSDKQTDTDDNLSKEDSIATNSIIDWLKWLGEKSGRIKPTPTSAEAPTSAENFVSYFNRWPFNSLFPIGKLAKPIRMPRRTASKVNDDISNEVEPMSQEHFESLLHTLPGFVVNASHVADTECRQQLQVFHRQLRGNKLWTLQMLDATAKINSGLLRGNINQFGDFELCTQIKTLVKITPDIPMRIRGKYCLAHIETQTDVSDLKLPVHLAHGRGLWNSHLENPSHFVPRYSVANWGICIPHLCSAEVVQEMLETNLGPYNSTGVEFHVEVDDNDCYMRQSRTFSKLLRKDRKFTMAFIVLASLALLMLMSVLHEYWNVITTTVQEKIKMLKRKKDTDTETIAAIEDEEENSAGADEEHATDATASDVIDESSSKSETIATRFTHLIQELIKSFSPKRTFLELVADDHHDMQFPIIHILKLGSTFMLYICLKYLMIGHLPLTNRDSLVQAMEQPFSILFRAPMIYTDILLLVSGFISAYQLSEEMAEKSHIQLLKRMTTKVARYLPVMYVVLLLQTWILPHLNSGPMWSNLIGQNAALCDQKMWRNVFSVQNSIDFEETCSPMTVQLGLEVQLYLLGPLIVWLYYTDADAAFFIYGGIHAMSVAARFSRTNREHLSMTLFHGMNVSKFYRTANILYSSPISRATPYLLGLGAGVLHRSQDGVLDIAPALVPLGWVLAALSILWCLWTPSFGARPNYIYDSGDAASYAAWSPLLLGLAICWIIFMCPRSENSIFKYLTASRPVLFLSRITLCLQLATYTVVLYNVASVKESLKYHVTDLVNFHEIGIIVMIAIGLAFFVDVPAQHLRRLFINRVFMERTAQEHNQEQEPASGAEQSEGETSEERKDAATCDTPEPAETVWGSDPEEEEQKYIARRRSSVIAIEDEAETQKAEKATKPDEKEAAAEDEEEEEEDENDIKEEDEVKKRPDTPPAKIEPPKPSYTRRRRPTSDD